MHECTGIPKLDDANDAGGRNSEYCTLILTEGDSAKTTAVAGLSVIGRDRYGIFPLRWAQIHETCTPGPADSCVSHILLPGWRILPASTHSLHNSQ